MFDGMFLPKARPDQEWHVSIFLYLSTLTKRDYLHVNMRGPRNYTISECPWLTLLYCLYIANLKLEILCPTCFKNTKGVIYPLPVGEGGF